MAGNPVMARDAAYGGDDDRAERFKTQELPHLDEVYTLARYLLRNASDADDAVQECYLRAFRHFDTFRGGPIKPWLLAILRNTCLASYAGGAKLVYLADTAEPLAQPVWREDVERPEQTMLRRHATETMQRLIGR